MSQGKAVDRPKIEDCCHRHCPVTGRLFCTQTRLHLQMNRREVNDQPMTDKQLSLLHRSMCCPACCAEFFTTEALLKSDHTISGNQSQVVDYESGYDYAGPETKDAATGLDDLPF